MSKKRCGPHLFEGLWALLNKAVWKAGLWGLERRSLGRFQQKYKWYSCHSIYILYCILYIYPPPLPLREASWPHLLSGDFALFWGLCMTTDCDQPWIMRYAAEPCRVSHCGESYLSQTIHTWYDRRTNIVRTRGSMMTTCISIDLYIYGFFASRNIIYKIYHTLRNHLCNSSSTAVAPSLTTPPLHVLRKPSGENSDVMRIYCACLQQYVCAVSPVTTWSARQSCTYIHDCLL